MSSRQQCPMKRSASSTCAWVSVGVDAAERSSPARCRHARAPRLRRPPEMMSSIAARSATRTGWLYPNGMHTAACPTRMRDVLAATGAEEDLGRAHVRVLDERVVLDRPDAVEAHLLGEDRLLDAVAGSSGARRRASRTRHWASKIIENFIARNVSCASHDPPRLPWSACARPTPTPLPVLAPSVRALRVPGTPKRNGQADAVPER